MQIPLRSICTGYLRRWATSSVANQTRLNEIEVLCRLRQASRWRYEEYRMAQTTIANQKNYVFSTWWHCLAMRFKKQRLIALCILSIVACSQSVLGETPKTAMTECQSTEVQTETEPGSKVVDPKTSEAVVIGIMGALVGALTAGFLSWLVGRKAKKLDISISLLNEWHSGEMRNWRDIAEKCLAENSKLEDAFTAADADQKHAISNVAHFLEKVEVLRRRNQLDDDFVKEAFGGVLRYWAELILGKKCILNEDEWAPLKKSVTSLEKFLS